ncbi:MAG: hypothetical protein KBT57_07920 [bacterium]|nr:hypothetical protein [Candidatus Limimorpha equi]
MAKVIFSDADRESFLRIKECVKDIVDHTKNMTEEKWHDEDVQYVLKDALVKLVEAYLNATDVVKQFMREYFADIDCIIHYCIDGLDGMSPDSDNYDKTKEEPDFVFFYIIKYLPLSLQKMNGVTI